DKLRELQADGAFQVIPISMIRGFSLENTWIIVDEAQNCSSSELWAILTRVGVGSRLIVMGDLTQCDLSGPSGLADVLSRVATLQGPDSARIRRVTLTQADCKRSPVVKLLLELREGGRTCAVDAQPQGMDYLGYDDLPSGSAGSLQDWVGHTAGLVTVSKNVLGLSPETWEMRGVLRTTLGLIKDASIPLVSTFDAVRFERAGVRLVRRGCVVSAE
ncbi:hypothetical protein FOZ63_018847, partial [Perkinsus olseni]